MDESRAASGQFDVAAAAYAMFLQEFGTTHAFSERVLERLAETLAPLDLGNVTVMQTPEGPRFQPVWRMQHEASADRLKLAASAYELLAGIAQSPDTADRASMSIGWIFRALNDWPASTAAWDRCANLAQSSRVTADALWHAAENLGWMNQPASAADRLRDLVARVPDDPRTKAAQEQIEVYEADARRKADWLKDPVASLQAEIAARSPARNPHEVYVSVRSWLRQHGEPAALAAVGRWAITQDDWPLADRVVCRFDLVDALLQPSGGSAEQKREAADVLGGIVALAPGDDWVIPAALRQCRLLSELGDYAAAEAALNVAESQVKDSPWPPPVLGERIRLLIDRGDLPGARSVRDQMLEMYPDYELPPEVAKALDG